MKLFRSRKRPEEREIRWALLARREWPNSRGWMQTFVIPVFTYQPMASTFDSVASASILSAPDGTPEKAHRLIGTREGEGPQGNLL